MVIKYLKKLFKECKEAGKDPFFNESKDGVPPSPSPKQHAIPVESLAKAVMSHESVYTYVSDCLTQATFELRDDPSKRVLIEINIDKYKSNVKMDTTHLFVKENISERGWYKNISEKQKFDLTEKESKYLCKVIGKRANNDLLTKQVKARQEIENVLQGVLSTSNVDKRTYVGVED